jgi:decaprenylphospho-beta-D-erythro-pentofuranosid-2-ulose 2-reductase
MSQTWKHAIVIGASSGIGRAVAEELVKRGVRTAVIARRGEELQKMKAASPKPEMILPFAHDVRNYQETEGLFQRITQELGGLDIIVYASGVMPSITENEYNFAKDLEIMEVNTLGAFAWLNEAAKRFERTKSGTIVGIGSVAGDRGRRGHPAYCTSKAAISTYLEALRNRLSRFGVKVVTIKPGFVDTVMTKGKPGVFWVISPESAANQILAAASSGTPVAYVPKRWRYVMAIIRSIPSFVFKRLPI